MALWALGTGFEFSKVYVEGIRAVTPVDIGYARGLGYRIKHLGLCAIPTRVLKPEYIHAGAPQ
ncbi:MAG: hypothetical protein CM15mP120_21540 [Pseudomonadota bacterium]|nr:MAG: hypothetical protein CM15mP120_21540 [Pseudomonadota bacterium]